MPPFTPKKTLRTDGQTKQMELYSSFAKLMDYLFSIISLLFINPCITENIGIHKNKISIPIIQRFLEVYNRY